MKEKIKIAVVDDQHLFRSGLISLLKEFEKFEVIMEASNGKEFLEAVKKKKPDVVLLDIEMPEMDGAEVTEYLNKKYPQIKIVILTMHNDDELVLHLARKGAHGFLLKDSDIETVADAVYSVMEGKRHFENKIADLLLNGVTKDSKIKADIIDINFSDKEIAVLKLICKEYTNKEISEKLALSQRTIEGYRESLLQKTGSRNTAGIVIYAVKHKLLD